MKGSSASSPKVVAGCWAMGWVSLTQACGGEAGQGEEIHLVGHLEIIGERDVDLRMAERGHQLFLIVLDLVDLGLRKRILERMREFGHDEGRQRHEAADIELAAHLRGRLEASA